MNNKVFGIGLHKTGTTTFASRAREQLQLIGIDSSRNNIVV